MIIDIIELIIDLIGALFKPNGITNYKRKRQEYHDRHR